MNSRWTSLTLCTVASIAVYVFMEWLFLVTKPSFMTAMDAGEKASVLAAGTLAAVLAGGSVLFPLQIVGWVSHSDRYQKIGLALTRVPAAIVVGSLGFLLIDNFTYTVWGWGVQSSVNPVQKAAYLLACAGLAVGSYMLISTLTRSARMGRGLWVRIGRWLPVVCVLGTSLLVNSALSSSLAASREGSRVELDRRPNILLVSGDGIDADHVSAYGYSRRTTPAIDRLVPASLFCENNFPNAAHTGASIASILTGRLPTETGLIYPPDILKGEDAHRHLPAILKRYGYSTVSITLRHYADAYDLNLRNGFDQSNFRTQGTYRAAWLVSGSFGHATTYFTETMINRLGSRLLHLTGRREMSDAFSEVTGAGTEPKNDVQRIAGLVSFLDSARPPFFAHIHLLATHGPDFAPDLTRFSQDPHQSEEWEVDFYDDAILTVDGYYARIEEELRELGLWEETLAVVFSDHGMRFATEVRTPLLFRFPGGEHARRIGSTTSNLDIAPTILDYLGVPIPEWMSGESLLQGDPKLGRPVLSAKKTQTGGERTSTGWRLDPRLMGPPFYSLGSVTAIVCQRAYRLNLDNQLMRVKDVEGHSAPCDPLELPKAEEIEPLLLGHLQENGYDITGLELPLRKRYSRSLRRDR